MFKRIWVFSLYRWRASVGRPRKTKNLDILHGLKGRKYFHVTWSCNGLGMSLECKTTQRKKGSLLLTPVSRKRGNKRLLSCMWAKKIHNETKISLLTVSVLNMVNWDYTSEWDQRQLPTEHAAKLPTKNMSLAGSSGARIYATVWFISMTVILRRKLDSFATSIVSRWKCFGYLLVVL